MPKTPKKTAKKPRKQDYTIATDDGTDSSASMPCYTLSGLEKRLGVDFGEKVQSNVRVRKWFREKRNELARKYGSSTCEFEEAITLSIWLADQGIKEFIILANEVKFYAQPILMRVVGKRRRLLKAEEEIVVSEAVEPCCAFCGKRPVVGAFQNVKSEVRKKVCSYHAANLRDHPKWHEVPSDG